MCHSATIQREVRLAIRLATYEDPTQFLSGRQPACPAVHDYQPDGFEGVFVGTLSTNSWVYVYEASPHGWWLRHEVRIRGGNMMPERVPWGRNAREARRYRRQYRDATSRACSGTLDGPVVTVSGTKDHVLILSDFQLPSARVEHYRTNEAQLRARGVTVPAHTSPPDGEQELIVPLVDPLAFAEAFHAEYAEATEAWLSYAYGDVHVKKRLLAHLSKSLADQFEDVRDQLRMPDLDGFLSHDERTLQRRQRAPARAAQFLTAWMRTSGFEAALADHAGVENNEERGQERYATCLTGILETRAGIAYMRDVAGEQDSWITRYFLSGDPFQHWRKTIAAVDTAFEELLIPFLQGRFAHYLRASVSEAARSRALRATAADIDRIVEQYVSLRGWEPNLLRSVDFSVGEGIGTQLTVTTPARAEDLRQWRQRVDGFNTKTKKLLLGIELVNLGYSIANLREAMGPGGSGGEQVLAGVGAVGSLSDVVGASEFLLTDRLVARGTLTQATATRLFGRIAIIGALCDYGAGVTGAAEASYAGDYGLAAGQATTALAAVALGSSTAAGTSGTALLGLAAGPWAVIGVLLFVIGTTLIWAFSEDPLEEWARQSPWGRLSPFQDRDLERITERHLDQQLERLVELIGQPRMRASTLSGADGHTVTVTIEAALLLAESDLRVTLEINKMTQGAYASTAPREQRVGSTTFSVPADAQVDTRRRRVQYQFAPSGDLSVHRGRSSAQWLEYDAQVQIRYLRSSNRQSYSLSGSVS